MDYTWGLPGRARTAGRRPLGAAGADMLRTQPSGVVACRAASVWRTNGPYSRGLDDVRSTKIKKPTRPMNLRQTINLSAEDVTGLGFLSEEEEEDSYDPMDLEYVPGRAAGRKLPSRGTAKTRTASRQAGAKRPREQPPSNEEAEHTVRSSKRARTWARAESASSATSSQATMLASGRAHQGALASRQPVVELSGEQVPGSGTCSPESSTSAILLAPFSAAAVAAAIGADLTPCTGTPTAAKATRAAAPSSGSPTKSVSAPADLEESSPKWADLIERCPHQGLQALAAQWMAEPPLGVVPPLKETDLIGELM